MANTCCGHNTTACSCAVHALLSALKVLGCSPLPPLHHDAKCLSHLTAIQQTNVNVWRPFAQRGPPTLHANHRTPFLTTSHCLPYLLTWHTPPLPKAHRLKNDQTLTNRALAGIHCSRRVLLSGTPMQNHLDEVCLMY